MFRRYILEQPFARGAQAQVFCARDKLTGKKCLIKFGDSVRKEAFLARDLNYPYLSKPYDFGVESTLGNYAAYEFLTYPTLSDWIKGRAANELRKPALHIAEFLAYLHHRGWLYNDFKPDHFLVGDDGVYVIDLGLCSRFDPAGASSTYDGTFPFIAPERLIGRASDQRSDIFAFGMMLLQLFFPREHWPSEPSLEVLQQLQRHVLRLKGFWRKLLSEMTALESSQRMGSAVEVWKKLLPQFAQKSFLFFPVNGSVPMSNEVFESESVLLVHSPSEIQLADVENLATIAAWKAGAIFFSIDLRHGAIEDAVMSLCRCLNEEIASDPYSALDSLEKNGLDQQIRIHFHLAEKLNTRESSFLEFALSRLSKPSNIRILLTSVTTLTDLHAGLWKSLALSPLTVQEVEQLALRIFPRDMQPNRPQSFRRRQSVWPDQVIQDLREELPQDAPFAWPAAAKSLGRPCFKIEKLSALERRALAGVAIAGGTIVPSLLKKLLHKKRGLPGILEKLLTLGCLQYNDDVVALTVSPERILNTFRPKQIKEIATTLLEDWPPGYNAGLYFVSLKAGNRRRAAVSALRMAREARRQKKSASSMDWFYWAFDCGSVLPKSVMYRLAQHFLLHSEIHKAERMLRNIRATFGRSFRWADLQLDLLYRQNLVDLAARFAERIASRAQLAKRPNAVAYFSIRHAGFLIIQNQFEKGEIILKRIVETNAIEAANQLSGMLHHLRGLSAFYQGRFQDAIAEFRKAIASKHRFRSNSLMNLGVAFGRLGQNDLSRKYLNGAINIFSRTEDADCLSYAYNNLGILCKQMGKLKEARENYFRSICLSRLSRNLNLVTTGTINMAATYVLEGRTDRSLPYYQRAIRLARTSKQEALCSFALTNAGLQYAIQGKFVKAVIAVKEAIAIRKKLGLKANLAASYQDLGITYAFAKQWKRSEYFLRISQQLFKESGSETDALRSLLFSAWICVETNMFEQAWKMIRGAGKIPVDTFEYGFHCFLLANLFHGDSQQTAEFRKTIHQAETIFRKTPSLYWLGKTYLLKARYFVQTDHLERAAFCLENSFNIFSRLKARKELLNVIKEGSEMKISGNLLEKMTEKLPFKILLMVKGVLSEKDSEKMIARILSTSLEFTEMERAVLILHGETPRIFKSTTLDHGTVNEICEISRSVLESTIPGKPLICLNASTDPSFKNRNSILANRIMSVVCLPLRVDNHLIGSLYLDSKEGVETLASTETVLLEIFAGIIALALNTSLVLEQSLEENEEFRASLGLKEDFPQIIGTSKPMANVLKTVQRLMNSDIPVLITGETGTGKELIARVLHFCGHRRNGPFVAVNCSALTESLLESELFGHEKGSFTGATGMRKGLFEEAKNGTLFLDEIGDMMHSMQAKFLRVLQDGEFRRVGGNETFRTNARIVLATNRNLYELIGEKKFREDLYYRIHGARIHLPALRERTEDIPLLASFFLKTSMAVAKKKIHGFTTDALDLMKRYSWPGNVRQLKSEIERIVTLSDHDWIDVSDFDPQLQSSPEDSDRMETLRELEKEWIVERLKRHEWNILHTARSLGLTRNGLYSKMKMYSIPKKPPASELLM